MKALSLHQPWATAIAIGVKSIETRGWPTMHRGLLAIHATKKYTMEDAETTAWYAEQLHDLGFDLESRIFSGHAGDEWRRHCPNDALGKVVCIVRLLDVVKIGVRYPIPPEPEAMFGDYAIGRYAWHLELVKVLLRPISVTGQRQIWNWDAPPEVEMLGLDAPVDASTNRREETGRSASRKR